MEAPEILQFVADAPMTLILLWLFIKERKELTEVRRAWDEERSRTQNVMIGLIERVTDAINELTFKA